ncbi:hypothetical protein PPL_09578 [Heterostelium album PN500]|uniref:Uncharacterized protein n=1 Tax=Heterostelium pallidum (strain ATCC 26659 / Pp 5 / PN500) TaxID=670386 RepID=D3BNQ7_HETP5|nr:hypothetical protein PPL_09578 [Heterostelium album PN500]EFA76826.1 hypothetical protein PPL_09578 [Heterostelium album PN500]|eukprot:XP_020428958.1 hypothetical protein PPL_09578 [Heterostelium album PN500]
MQYVSTILNKYVGNRVVFSNSFVQGICEKYPKIAFLNDAYTNKNLNEL